MSVLIGTNNELMNQVVDVIWHLPSDKVFEVTVEEYKTKRSLDANAYFHVLLMKLAKTLRMSLEVVKKQMVCDYSTGVYIRMPDGQTPEMFGIKYALNIGAAKGTKVPCTDYLVFKPTHEMDSGEMARLIEGTREECIHAGIPENELLTPDEIANLKGIREG